MWLGFNTKTVQAAENEPTPGQVEVNPKAEDKKQVQLGKDPDGAKPETQTGGVKDPSSEGDQLVKVGSDKKKDIGGKGELGSTPTKGETPKDEKNAKTKAPQVKQARADEQKPAILEHFDNVTISAKKDTYSPQTDNDDFGFAVNIVDPKDKDEYQFIIGNGAFKAHIDPLNPDFGTTQSTKNTNDTTTFTDTFGNIGSTTVKQNISISKINKSDAIDNILKVGETEIPIQILKNNTEIGKVSFKQVITPKMEPEFSREVPKQTSVGQILNNVDYKWVFNLKEAGLNTDKGSTTTVSGVNKQINAGTTITIPVPDSFVLNKDKTEANYNSLWNVTVNQSGKGQDVVITIPKSSSQLLKANTIIEDYSQPIYLVGKFETNLTKDQQELTAAPGTVTQEYVEGSGIPRKTWTLPPFKDTLMSVDGNPLGDYGYIQGIGGAYKDKTVPLDPLGKNPTPYRLYSYVFGNGTPQDINNATVTIEVPDGVVTKSIVLPTMTDKVDYEGVLTYSDGTTKNFFSKEGTVNADKNIRKIVLTFKTLGAGVTTTEWPSGTTGDLSWEQDPHDGRLSLNGYVAAKHDDGTTPVTAKDTLKSTIFITSKEAPNVGKSYSATQQVVVTDKKVKHIAVYNWQNVPNSMNYESEGHKPGAEGGSIRIDAGKADEALQDTVFYIVLPNNAEVSPNQDTSKFSSKWEQGSKFTKEMPKITTFTASDGKRVAKIDYTGCGKVIGSKTNLFLRNLNDAPTMTGHYKVYVVNNKIRFVDDDIKQKDLKPVTDPQELQYVQDNPNAYLIGQDDWRTSAAEIVGQIQQSKGNQDLHPLQKGKSDVTGDKTLTFTQTIANGSDKASDNVQSVINLPSNGYAGSEYDFKLSDLQVININTGKNITSNLDISYSDETADLKSPDTSKFNTDQKSAKSILIKIPSLAKHTNYRVVLTGQDPDFTKHSGLTGYLSSAISFSSSQKTAVIEHGGENSDSAASITLISTAPIVDQNAEISYIDDFDNTDIVDPNKISGQAGQEIKFGTDPTTKISELEQKGYVLVSNNFKAGTKYQKDDNNNKFEVHFTHDVKKVTKDNIPKDSQITENDLTNTVTLTVNYVNSDGTPFTGEVPANAKQTLTFEGTVYVDKLTGKMVHTKDFHGKLGADPDNKTAVEPTWTEKDGKTGFEGVSSPEETGYQIKSVIPTPYGDKDNNVKAISGITYNSETIEITVTYEPLSGQKLTYTIIDDADIDSAGEGKKLVQDKVLATGSSNAKIPEDTKQKYEDVVNAYLNDGYVLVSKADLPVKFDTDPKKAQNVIVYLTHGVKEVTPDNIPEGSKVTKDDLTKAVKLTVNYVNSDGTTFTGKVPANANQTLTFQGMAYVDKVTGKMVHAKKLNDTNHTLVVDPDNSDEVKINWKDGKKEFEKVISPTEIGYKIKKVSAHGDNENNVEAISGITHDSADIKIKVIYEPITSQGGGTTDQGGEEEHHPSGGGSGDDHQSPTDQPEMTDEPSDTTQEPEKPVEPADLISIPENKPVIGKPKPGLKINKDPQTVGRLPQTGSSDQSTMAAIVGSIFAGLGLLGLGEDLKHRRKQHK